MEYVVKGYVYKTDDDGSRKDLPDYSVEEEGL